MANKLRKQKGGQRKIYPLDITKLDSAIARASAKTGITSKAQLMRLAIERGLPVVIAALDRRAA